MSTESILLRKKNRTHKQKFVHFILPCGRVIRYKSVLPRELATKVVRAAILKNKPELRKLINPDVVGRKRRQWADRVYAKIAGIIINKMVDNLMESSRIETAPGRYWAIVGRQSLKHLNWHTDGYAYSVRIIGLNGPYGVTLSKLRRTELKKRIESGQKFHIEQNA
jgi:hypothetical protein